MLNKKIITEELEISGRKLVLEVGRLAPQATSAVMARHGDAVVLATVVMGGVRPDLDYFPLSVEYVERLYAGGRIKGSRWVKREGRPSDDAVLSGRLIDRSIRPLFPKDFKNEVQVTVTVLSVDGENHPDVVAGIATSAALAISPIPWKGPIGVVRVGLIDGVVKVNPVNGEMIGSKLDLVVSSTSERVVMIEAGAKVVEEQEVMSGILAGHGEAVKIVKMIERLVDKVGAEKLALPSAGVLNERTVKVVDEVVRDRVKELVEKIRKSDGDKVGEGLNVKEIYEQVKEKAEGEEGAIKSLIEKLWKREIRKVTLAGKRVDGRRYEEIRDLACSVAILPRTHGSGLFQRGLTHVLSVVTLGIPSLEQWIESAEGEEQKRYMHHYSMPPYSTGETGRMGSPSRREIGHGALAEKAVFPVLPSKDEFPYAIRVVSEVMSSNGSTSMGSTCASILALMDAGVPIKAPVAGIAMGLIWEEKEKPVILTDIAGIEDFNGDTDFKVAGTAEGITAMQMDVKIAGLTLELVEEILKGAKDARMNVLKVMGDVIVVPRSQLSPYAPMVEVVTVPVEKIGEVIGPGGKVIRKIIAETKAQVDVEDDGKVTICGLDKEGVKRAVQWVKDLVREVVAGEIFEGTVKRIMPFGAFVEVLPGKEGLVHVSRMGMAYVSDPNDVVQIGQKVQVRVSEIDELGRINLSMILDPELEKEAQGNQQGFQGGQQPRGMRPAGEGRGNYSQSGYSGRFPQVHGDNRGGFVQHRRPGGGQRHIPRGRREGR